MKRREDEDEVSAYLNAALGHQMLAMAQKRRVAQWLGEDISDHGLSVDIGDRDDALLLLLAHIVVSQRDVLSGGAIDRIVGHRDCALTVAVDVDGLDELIHIELRSEVMKPARFFSSLGAGAVLAVVRRSSNRGQ